MVKKVRRKERCVRDKSNIKNSFEREIKIGIIIEKKEHGFSLVISRKIATDHIKKFPKYYTDKRYGLIATEKKLKNR